MDREFKVGVFIVVAIVVLVGFLMYGGKLQFLGNVYTLYVDFPYVEGLKEGAEVRELGVTVGKVINIRIISPNTVRVKIVLRKGYPIREKSTIYISTEGILGSKIIDIIPSSTGNKIPAGAVVRGESPVRFRDMIVRLDSSIKELSTMLASFKNFWIEKGTERKLLSLLNNLQEGSEKISGVISKVNDIADNFSDKISKLSREASSFVSELKEMVRSNKKDVRSIVVRLNNILKDFRVLSKEIKNRPMLVRNLNETILSIKKAANDTSRFINVLSGETANGNSTGAKGVLTSIRKIEKMTKEAEKVVKDVKSWRVKGGIRLRYGSQEGETLSDIWVRVSKEGGDTSLFLGLSDVGGGSYFTGMLERSLSKNTQIKYGILRGDLGVGYRYYFSKKAYISADMKIAHNWKVDIDAYYPTSPKYGLFFRVNDIFDQRRFYIGFEYRF